MSAFYTLAEVAQSRRMYEVMKDPVRWLRKEIRAGRLPGRKVGRSYCMTDEGIALLEDTVSSPANVTPIQPVQHRGPSKASMRRRLSA